MQLVKFRTSSDEPLRVGIVDGPRIRPLIPGQTLTNLLDLPDPAAAVPRLIADGDAVPIEAAQILAPIENQEVWGAGVTYERSKRAREEESESGGTFYDQVYRADRPELFFKATPRRVVGPGQAIRVRRDSHWSVPEPELALVLSSALKLVGFTIGNDVSARDIEGRNPLYLPQAKIYDGSCALGPAVTLAAAMPAESAIGITLRITRGSELVFEGSTSTAHMARRFADLIDWLGRDNRFPDGVILLTGTGIIPPDEVALRDGDHVAIRMDGIGTLENPVVQAREPI
jgi:2-dehydro-3-deoxy-D-arabinonate dehydratase